VRCRTGPAVVALALVSALLLAGCGGGDDKGEASDTTAPGETTTVPAAVRSDKPCDLVTEAEVSAAVGAPVKAGSSGGSATGTQCTFALATGADSLILVVKSTDPGNAANYDTFKSAAEAPKDLTGIGDKGFVAGGQAVVLTGTNLFVVVTKLDRPAAALADASTKIVRAAAT
jgi:Protein of unknown function (DUF3558)